MEPRSSHDPEHRARRSHRPSADCWSTPTCVTSPSWLCFCGGEVVRCQRSRRLLLGGCDRPPKRRSRLSGATPTSPRQSQRTGRTKNKSDRGETCGLTLEQRRCFCPEAVVGRRIVGADVTAALPRGAVAPPASHPLLVLGGSERRGAAEITQKRRRPITGDSPCDNYDCCLSGSHPLTALRPIPVGA